MQPHVKQTISMKVHMKYVNSRTGVSVALDDLSDIEKQFYQRVREQFEANAPWLLFDELAFGVSSPIYSGRTSHLDVLEQPLYLALKDMSLELGVRQGLIAAKQPKERDRKASAGRKEKRSRQAAY